MDFWGRREDPERRDDRKSLNDQQAIERYRYMLRTAPPEMIEEAHQEAFARLTPDQRRMILQGLTEAGLPESRRATDDPASLARLATRTEIRQPGMLERVFGSSRMGGGFGGGMGMGLGGMFAGSLLASIAGTFVASSIAHSFFDQHPFDGDTAAGANEMASSEHGSDAVDDPSMDTADGGLGDFGGGFDGGDIEI